MMCMSLMFLCLPAHSDIIGNELADKKAKEATNSAWAINEVIKVITEYRDKLEKLEEQEETELKKE